MTTAVIVNRSKRHVGETYPDVHPHRILTLPSSFLGGEKGDEISVELRGDIEPSAAGWTGFVVQQEGI